MDYKVTYKQKQFLTEYKQLCLKYGIQILGFDDGAFLFQLDKEEMEIGTLTWDKKRCNDFRFADKHSFNDDTQKRLTFF